MTDGGAVVDSGAAVGSPLVAPATASWRVRLVPRTVDDSGATLVVTADPFVVLHEGRHGRVLLAEVVSADGRPGPRFVWKLRRDEPRGLPGATPSNGDVDAAWARERDDLLRARSPHVTALSPLASVLAHGAPLWWCRRLGRAFHPVDATTGTRLATCRDDAVLAAHGLPPYATDTVRYATGAPGVFYRAGATQDVTPLASGATVRSARQWVRDLLPLVRSASPAAAARAHGDLPCLSCTHRETCFPAAAGDRALPAERELLPVSLHDVDGIALELHDFDFAAAVALLGGASPTDLPAGLGRGDPGRAAVLRQELTQPPQWFFAADPGRHLLEVLRQKVALVLDVATGLAALHATGRPHLGLAPAHVLVSLLPGAGLPVRWRLRAVLADLGSADLAGAAVHEAVVAGAPRRVPGADVRGDVVARACVGEAVLAQEPSTAVLPVACWRAGDNDGLVRCCVEARGTPRGARAGDLVVVQPVAGGATLVAVVDEIRPRGLLASALLPPGDPCLQWDGQQFEAALTCHRRLGPAADGHGLGALLLHALLVDDEQGLDTVLATMLRALGRFGEEPTGVRLDERSATERFAALLAAPEFQPQVSVHHLLHRAADRRALQQALPRDAAPVPLALWQRLLVAAARALAGSAPFAWANSLAEGPGPVAAFVAELQAVLARLDVELFTAASRDAAVASALAELGGVPGPAAAPPAAPRRGFRLLSQRDGDGKTQELRYEIDRVTIGRREGENLLRLNDPMVSSAHAVIEWSDEGWVVFDRNSTNGTEVDGIRLPVEVPQPLQEGSVIVIRPFRLTFQALAATAPPSAAGGPSAAALRERLHDAFAVHAPRGSVAVHEALLAVLREAARELPAGELPRRLGDASAPGGDATARPVDVAAARALQQLSRSLLGPAEFQSPEQVQQFVGKLGRFVDTTAHWIERLLEVKRALGKHLDFGIATTGTGRPQVRTAAEVRALVAGWAAEAPPPEAAAWYTAKFYDDVLAMLLGLLGGNQAMRKAVRERLDPQRLVEAVGREATLKLLVQATANSALWQAYVQAFQEVTGSSEQDAELARVLQQAAALRQPPG